MPDRPYSFIFTKILQLVSTCCEDILKMITLKLLFPENLFFLVFLRPVYIITYAETKFFTNEEQLFPSNPHTHIFFDQI